MSLTAADRARSAEHAGAVHQTTIERAFGRIFAMLIALIVVVFWFNSATLAGQRPGSVAANLLLSALLVWQAARALRRPPFQQDLHVLAAATGALLLVSRALAVPGSPFLVDDAYLLAVLAAVAWAVWSVRFAVPCRGAWWWPKPTEPRTLWPGRDPAASRAWPTWGQRCAARASPRPNWTCGMTSTAISTCRGRPSRRSAPPPGRRCGTSQPTPG